MATRLKPSAVSAQRKQLPAPAAPAPPPAPTMLDTVRNWMAHVDSVMNARMPEDFKRMQDKKGGN